MDYPREHIKTHMSPRPPDMGERLNTNEPSKIKLFMSEFLGTYAFVYLGQASLTSLELIGTQNDTINRQLATILSQGLAYLFAALLTINLSGAHLNPAYTFARASYRFLDWGRALNYIFAQYLGSFVAAIFLHATYSDKIAQRHTEGLLTGMNSTLRAHGNILSTGKFFSSYPPTEVSLTQLSISYILASIHFMFILLFIQESKPRFIKPIYMSLALISIQTVFCANGGPVLNPAQDFSPRLYIAMFGWGPSAFNLYHNSYWWICGLIAPHVGALIGFGVYRVYRAISSLDKQVHQRIQDEDHNHDYTLPALNCTGCQRELILRD